MDNRGKGSITNSRSSGTRGSARSRQTGGSRGGRSHGGDRKTTRNNPQGGNRDQLPDLRNYQQMQRQTTPQNPNNFYPVQQYNGKALQDINEFPALDDLEATCRARLEKHEISRSNNLVAHPATGSPQKFYDSPRSNGGLEERKSHSPRQYQNRGNRFHGGDSRSSRNNRRSGQNGRKHDQQRGHPSDITQNMDNVGMENAVIHPSMFPVLFWNPYVIVSPPSMPGRPPMPGNSKFDQDSSFLYRLNVKNPDLTRMDRLKCQLEYYFSPGNLRGDMFMRWHMDSEGYVEFKVIMNFNRMRIFMATESDVKTIINKSDELEYAEEPLRIRKKHEPLRWLNENLYDEVMQIFYVYFEDERFSEWYLKAQDFIHNAAAMVGLPYLHPTIAGQPGVNVEDYKDFKPSDQLLNLNSLIPHSQNLFCMYMPQGGGFQLPVETPYMYNQMYYPDEKESGQVTTQHVGDPDSNREFRDTIHGIADAIKKNHDVDDLSHDMKKLDIQDEAHSQRKSSDQTLNGIDKKQSTKSKKSTDENSRSNNGESPVVAQRSTH